MKPLKKIAALAVVLVGLLSFSAKETKSLSALNLDEINVLEMLSKQQFECRPSSDFVFYVETNLVKKVRGANNINAKVYILDKISGKKNLLAQEDIQVKKYEDAISLKDYNSNNTFKSFTLENGDEIIGSSQKTPYAFDELLKYEAIYNGYINSTNKLLRLKRSI